MNKTLRISFSLKNAYRVNSILYSLKQIPLIGRLFSEGHETLVMAGGSGFYIDAVCKGLDDFPPADQELRATLTARLKAEGVESLRLDLKRLDPESYATIDIANGQRVVRALEVCLMTGRKFSSFKTSTIKKRDFEVEKIGLTRPRDVLYGRINHRVSAMLEDGLVEEVRSLIPYRDLPALQTVGYREIFEFLDGSISLERAAELVRRNTRHYAKRQMTWWGRDKDIRWIEL